MWCVWETNITRKHCVIVLQDVMWTYWGCCVCTEDRCAAAAARGQHSLCGTREDTATPADTEKTTRTRRKFTLIPSFVVKISLKSNFGCVGVTWLWLNGSRQTAQLSASTGWDGSRHGLGWRYFFVFSDDILFRTSCLGRSWRNQARYFIIRQWARAKEHPGR